MNLVIIPARGGSKGVPRKNIKKLNGKPLIYYTIEVARSLFSDDQICVSTDDAEIKSVVEDLGLKVPFLRPQKLASDFASTYDALIHTISFYESHGKTIENVIVLQPTSPFRTANQLQCAWIEYLDCVEVEAMVSVKETSSNPYYLLFEENEFGHLQRSKKGKFTRRQDCPSVWELNGAIYIVKAEVLKQREIFEMDKIVKFRMDEYSSLDIDSQLDWEFAEFLLNRS